MGFKTKYDNSKNNLSGLNEQKASFRKSFLGILGAFLNVILPILILLGVTIYFIFTILDSADYYPYQENLSYMYALSTLSTLGAFGGIFYLIFWIKFVRISIVKKWGETMPNIKSAKKRVKTDAIKKVNNKKEGKP